MANDLTDQMRALGALAGRFIVKAEVNEKRELTDPVFTGFGPDDLILNVYDCRVRLCRAVEDASGYHPEDALADEDYAEPEVVSWLDFALQRAGGAIDQSGQYQLVESVPPWLAALAMKRVRR